MITDKKAELAAEYIRDNAPNYAKAKSEMTYLHEFRKSKKAILINSFEGIGTIQDKASYAYSHSDYLEVLDGYRIAVEEAERLKWMIEAAKIKIEIWRTQQANNRMIDGTHK